MKKANGRGNVFGSLCISLLIPIFAVSYVGLFFEIYQLPYPYDAIGYSPLPAHYMDIYNRNKYSYIKAVESFTMDNSVKLTNLDDKSVRKLFEGVIHGAESVAVTTINSSSKLIMLDKYGNIRTAEQKSLLNDFDLKLTSTYIGPGRPLGFHHHYLSDTLVVCDSVKGLLAVDISDRSSGNGHGDRVRILTNSYALSDLASTTHANAINYANDLDISADGRIVYFSSSTAKGVVAFDSKFQYYDTMRSFLLTWLSGDVSGRVFSYDMQSKTTALVAENLFYANGVALSTDGSYLFVVETMGLRVWKVYLEGEKKGTRELFIEDLPGFPDGISRSRDGQSIFISIVAPLSPILPMAQSYFHRWLIAWALLSPLDIFFSALIKKFGCVIRVAADTAQVQAVYLDGEGSHVSTISSVTEDSSGRLFFGNLGGDFVSYYQPE